MSVEPSGLLGEAQALVAAQLARLRGLVEGAQQRSAQLEQDLRQTERLLDEAVTQHRFANERQLPSSALLAERERQRRSEHDVVVREFQTLRRALKLLDQLVRQIEMSSATLNGEGDSGDPWTQALRSQVIMGREEERIRLAREVHDGPAQVLANALMGLEHSRSLLEGQQYERLGVMLDRMGGAAREGLHEVRRFIADLRPGRLEELGLVAALHDYVKRYRDAINTRVVFEADKLPRLGAENEIVLYRIAQEALQNAHKHASGAPVQISLTLRHSQVVLYVHDEGPGFDPRAVVRRTGHTSWGLTSMRERAELIGARFTVNSQLGHGTELAVVLPWRNT